MVTDDRDQAGDDGGDPARPDTQAPHQLRPALGAALPGSTIPSAKESTSRTTPATHNPANVIARRPTRDSGHPGMWGRLLECVVIP